MQSSDAPCCKAYFLPSSAALETDPLSFFEDADETRAAPRRAGGGSGPPPRGTGGRRPPRGGGGSRSEEIRRRQLIAGGGALVLLIIIILGFKSCSDSAAKRGLRSYARDTSSIIRGSDADVSKPLFSLLSGAGSGSAKGIELQNQVNNLKVQADDDLKRAAALDVPDQLIEAQRNVLLTLELRRDGVARIAQLLQPALGGTNGGTAVRRIAGEMRSFDASDVIWSQRVIPLIQNALHSGGVAVGGSDGEQIARSAFLSNAAWLDPTYVASALGSGTSASTGGPVKPGTHGHAVVAVTSGQTTLTSGAVSRIPATPTPTFSVKIQNQGQNDETRVRVRITLTGVGAKMVVTKTLPTTTAGGTATASIPLTRKPTIGTVGTLRAEVLPVPGEVKKDNNAQTFQVLFTR